MNVSVSLKLMLLCTLSSLSFSCRNSDGIAAFSFEKHSYKVAEEIQLVNLSQHAKSFKWYFGDGNSSVETAPVHRFSKAGTYRIRLVVDHSSEMSKQVVIVEESQ